MFSINPSIHLCKRVRIIMPRTSRRGDTAETNIFIVWPNDDIRTVTISTDNYGLQARTQGGGSLGANEPPFEKSTKKN